MNSKEKSILNKIIRDYKMLAPSQESLELLNSFLKIDERPIYTIMMMTNSGADELVYDTGKRSGFPDTGNTAVMGFYYDYEDAVAAMHENACDIRECCYDYGFILTYYPGMYSSASRSKRTYFKWDNEKCGFFEAEEPKLLNIIAF